jgi:hypothetical protein
MDDAEADRAAEAVRQYRDAAEGRSVRGDVV